MVSVLVIDDDAMLNETYCAVLKADGIETTGVLNGKDGLEFLKENSPDIIFLDLKMPEMDGIEFLKLSQIKTTHPDTIVIVFTASADQEDMVEAYTHGARSYVLKLALLPDELPDIVSEAIEKYRS